MKKLVVTAAAVSIFLGGCAIRTTGRGAEIQPNPTSASKQMVLVTTKDWEATTGELRFYERDDTKALWTAIGQPIAVNVGRNGMAWGRGMHVPNDDYIPVKQEGDGKSPAGVFRLTTVFGFADNATSKIEKMPYIHLTPTVQCIEDIKSSRYNRIVDASEDDPDWNSTSLMSKEQTFRVGVFVEHNPAQIPAAGSCIMLHIWRGQGFPTLGCTSMDAQMMEWLAERLNAGLNPILVQLVDEWYIRLRSEWALPEK